MNKVILLFVLIGASSCLGYSLKNAWYGGQIFDNFDFWDYKVNGGDPTHGYVYYAGKTDAFNWGLASVNQNGQAVIKSDSVTRSTDPGRPSVRLGSRARFTKGLFIFDVVHMPWGKGTWPAIWTTQGNPWPAGGEIDILEGVNDSKQNQMTLHTSGGCYVPTNQFAETGVPQGGDCGSPDGKGNNGCPIIDYDSWSYGQDFNNNGGGVWAMQWEDSGVYIWLWARNFIPSDILNGNPNPATWPNPRGRFTFNQGCTASSYFYNHQIIIDNTFCGDWAGNVFPGGMQACINYVRDNPSAFNEAYWIINSIKVYQ